MKIPYALTPAVPLPQRYAHMESAIARGLPHVQSVALDDTRTLSIACYGPSLRDTWQTLTPPILSMSGATKWLVERGVVPTYHIDMDPRPNKVYDVTPPVPGVTYLLASVCCPQMFDVLRDSDVQLWHTVSSNMEQDLAWVAQRDPGAYILHTGSTIGLGAIQLGGFMGYRHFEIHGMDGSFGSDGARHAGYHSDPKKQKDDITWDAGGVTYRTSKIMANAVAETINQMRVYPIFAVFHGNGLTQALLREAQLPNVCCVDEARVEFVRRARPRFFQVMETNRKKITTWSPWEAICWIDPDPNWVHELQVAFAIADARRPLARFNTGSITLETGLLLRALCHWKRPRVIVEIGTFIGKSTVSLQATERLYTCDRDNDCFPTTHNIFPHPFMTSTALLKSLVGTGERVDLFFFDGRLTDEDVALVLQLSRPSTIYAFDDYHVSGKGHANVEKLAPRLPFCGLVEPYTAFAGRTTLALLVPDQEALARAA